MPVIHDAGSLQEAMDNTPTGPNGVLLGIEKLKRKSPQALVVMLSSQSKPETARLALSRGAAGFVSKAEAADHIVQATDGVLQASTAAPPAPGDISSAHRLTLRQCEVMDLLNQGLSREFTARPFLKKPRAAMRRTSWNYLTWAAAPRR